MYRGLNDILNGGYIGNISKTKMTQIKYLQVVQKVTPSMKHCLEEIPRRGGMYNWIFLFKGSMMPISEVTPKILEDYDVIQINLAPVDQLLIKRLRNMLPKSSSTLLIGNNDYTCEAWETWRQHPLQYLQAQDELDAVFGTEKHQVTHLRDDAYVIPHPHWISMLKHIGNDDLETDRYKVGAVYHWWENKAYSASLMLEKLRRKYKLVTRLYGYTPKNDPLVGWQKVMWDNIMPLMEYPKFQRSLMTNRFIIDNCSYHTYGRTSVDTAALGIPTIGSDRIFSMKQCFPNMCCDPFDLKTLSSIAERVLKDGRWLDEQMSIASDRCEYFNYKNSKSRYMEMVEEVR